MDCKTFEIRDHATFIPVMCIKMVPGNEADRYLMRRTGWLEDHIVMWKLSGDKIHMDWFNGRTERIAFEHICGHWSTLESGAVIDVEFIAGETKQCKISERSS